MKRIQKQDLFILDDFGLKHLDKNSRLMLLELMEDRHGIRSTIIISQFPPPGIERGRFFEKEYKEDLT